MTAVAARRAGLVLAGAVPLAALVIFFGYPVVAMLARGFTDSVGLDLSGVRAVLERPRFARVLAFTVWQAAASAALAVAFGIPGAYLLYRTRFRGQAALRALVTVPFVLPTVVVGLAFLSLLGEGAPLGSWGLDGSVASILLAHLFLNYAVVVRTVGSTWAALDHRAEEAAMSLGASRWRAFRTITLPALAPSIAAAGLLVFLFCATSFGIVTVLGNGAINTLETEIYRQTTDILDLRTAAVLSVAQILLVGIVLTGSAWLRRRTEARLRIAATADARKLLRPSDAPAVVLTLAIAVLLVVPVATLVVRSLRTASGWGFGNYSALATVGGGRITLVSGWEALGNSLSIAAQATLFALTVGMLLSVVLARRPRGAVPRRLVATLDGLVMLPLGVSAATVGFGFLIALDEPPLDLRTSPLLVPIAQALVAVPLVVRLVLPTLRGLDDRLRQAASMLGASPLRVWLTVDLPLVSRPLAGAAAFAFAVALGEFGATSFLSRPENMTLPVLVGRLVSRPGEGNAGMAYAGGVVLAAVCALTVLAVDRLAGGRNGSEIGVFS